MWVWDRPPVADLVHFAHEQAVRDLFVSTPGRLPSSSELPWFRALRSRTEAAGVRVHALAAETWWLDDPAAAIGWQRDALGTGLFDGVHLDVEPWQHPRWADDAGPLLASWVGLLSLLAGDTTRPVEADVPFWLHEHVVGTRPADEAVMEVLAAATVLSYRRTATGSDSIIGVAGDALATAERLGRPVRLAVETRWLGGDPVARKQTFFGASRADLTSVLDEVAACLSDHPTFRGVSVHDHRGWSALRA